LASNKKLRILVVRPDRLGDVVLSTPVFQVIRAHYPDAKVVAMVRDPIAPVIRGLASVDEVLIYEPESRHAGIKGFFRLLSEIRRGQFQIAIVLQSQWRIGLAVFLSSIRYRVGPLSRLHSFLFYNRGIRQRRSQVEMHETDYNLQLLRRLGIRVGTRQIPTSVAVSEAARAKARGWLKAQGWDEGHPLIVVHPGMGGSALNWPEAHYQDLVRALLKDGRQVLVTAGPTESELIGRIAEAAGPGAKGVFYYGGRDVGPVDELAALFALGSVVVAPSTGPLHLAVAVGRPVVSFYPPIRVQSALRWGPYRPDEENSSVLVPEVFCGEDFKCRGHVCHHFPCMKSLSVAQALEQVELRLLSSTPKEQNPS
jgi:ADP-heptose:LPS heptosyltransferase